MQIAKKTRKRELDQFGFSCGGHLCEVLISGLRGSRLIFSRTKLRTRVKQTNKEMKTLKDQKQNKNSFLSVLRTANISSAALDTEKEKNTKKKKKNLNKSKTVTELRGDPSRTRRSIPLAVN